jgi:hypothetical protein
MTEQTIQGQSVGSILELNVAIALDKLGFDYEYQYVFGLLGVRGSQVIDFLVYTLPKPTPLFIHGRYWHTGKLAAEDELKMAELTSRTRNHWAEPVIIWEEDCETEEDALTAVRRELIF